MKLPTAITFVALSVASFAGCGVDPDQAQPDEIETKTSALTCPSQQAAHVVLAGLATSAAYEMRRWRPETDFVYANGVLSVSSIGRLRCSNPSCPYTQAWLNLQNWAAHGERIEGEVLDVGVLRSRIESQWRRQIDCNSRPDGHAPGDCPSELHDLVFSFRSNNACSDSFRFHAYKAGTTSHLQFAQQLKNKLIWAGYPDNPYLSFDFDGDDVTLAPGGNSQGGGSGTTQGVYAINPTAVTTPFCSAVGVGALSQAGVVATLGGQCQCMTTPAQPIRTFKAASVSGWLRCTP